MLMSFPEKKNKTGKKDIEVLDVWDDFSSPDSDFDILGSYTGNPAGMLQPEQDADDL